MSVDESQYGENFDIQGYWQDRHRIWLENPDWGAYPYKQSWFRDRFSHLMPVDKISNRKGPYEVGSTHVLDYGCGAGLYAEPLLDWYDSYDGFDTSVSAIACANRYYKQPRILDMSFQVYTGEIGQFQGGWTNQYDLVVSITVLQHQPVSYRLAMVENIKRLLKPGGFYLGLEWSDAYSQAADMPPIPEQVWRNAWLPLVIERDVPVEHPDWRNDNAWIAK